MGGAVGGLRSSRAAALARAAVALAALAALDAAPVMGQSLTLDLGEENGGSTARIVQFIGLITVLSLAPSLLMMVTSFTRIVVVLSLLRSAIGIQQTPPNAVMVSLALFLTFFIMAPVLDASWQQGIQPMIAEEVDPLDGLQQAAAPFHAFMRANVREKDVALFLDLSRTTDVQAPEALPYQVLIPAFMISELRRAFEIGFLLFLPFLIIDMIVSSILMAMGMMMLPPVMISLPFKLIFFVLVDGWWLIAGSLVQSYSGFGT